MKQILPAFILVLFLSSCTYQYFTVSSEQLAKNENEDFVVENDTLKVTYRFSGDHGPVRITIFNKTNDPLEIDWRKSALIIDGKAYEYYSPNLFLNGSVRSDTTQQYYNNVFRSDPGYLSDVNATIYVSVPSQFIPPKSFVAKIPLSLPVHSIPLPDDQLKKETYLTATKYNIRYKKVKYLREQSPVSFRSYLSFNYAGDQQKSFSMEQLFYVSEIWQSTSNPASFTGDLADKGNFFYLPFRIP